MKIRDILIQNNEEKVPVGETPYIEIGDIDIVNKNYIYKDKPSVKGAKYAYKDSIIVSTVRPTRGAISIIQEEKIAVSSGFAILKVDETKCLTKYLFNYINSPKFLEYLGFQSTGSTYPTCSKEDILSYEINLPTIEQQRKIIKEFEYIYSLIKNREEQINYFNSLIKSKFINIFGNPITNEKKWNVTKLSELGTLKNGMNFNRDDDGYKIKFLGVGEFKYGCNIDENSLLQELSLSEKPKEELLLKEGDIVFVRSNGSKELVGRSVLICNLKFETTYSGFCIRFRNESNLVNSNFLINLFQLEDFKKALLKDSRGANINNINQQMLSNIDVILPPLEIQNKFSDMTLIIKENIEICQNQITDLQILTNKKMYDYFN